MTVFKSAKNKYSVALLWVLAICLPIPIIFAMYTEGEIVIFPIILIALVDAFLISMLLDTKYIVSGNTLSYRSGPIRGKIDILKIRKIEENNSFIKYSTLKPGLSYRGFVIHFNAYDDIFISPDNKEKFVALMLEINPEIQVC